MVLPSKSQAEIWVHVQNPDWKSAAPKHSNYEIEYVIEVKIEMCGFTSYIHLGFMFRKRTHWFELTHNTYSIHIVCIVTCMYTYAYKKYAVYRIYKISDIIYGMYIIYPFALNCCFNFRLPSLRSGWSDVAAPESSESCFNTVTVLMNEKETDGTKI